MYKVSRVFGRREAASAGKEGQVQDDTLQFSYLLASSLGVSVGADPVSVETKVLEE